MARAVRWGCSCSLTIAWLADRGWPHASRVRALHLPEDRWSDADWIQHTGEEDRSGLFRHFPPRIANILRTHHRIIRDRIRRGLRLDPAFLQRHAQLEERYTRLYAPPLAA